MKLADCAVWVLAALALTSSCQLHPTEWDVTGKLNQLPDDIFGEPLTQAELLPGMVQALEEVRGQSTMRESGDPVPEHVKTVRGRLRGVPCWTSLYRAMLDSGSTTAMGDGLVVMHGNESIYQCVWHRADLGVMAYGHYRHYLAGSSEQEILETGRSGRRHPLYFVRRVFLSDKELKALEYPGLYLMK